MSSEDALGLGGRGRERLLGLRCEGGAGSRGMENTSCQAPEFFM